VAAWINFSRDLMVNFWGRGGSVHKINKFNMSEVRSLSIHDRFIEPQRLQIERLKIVTAIFVQKMDMRRVPTIHINHAYPIVMTVGPVVLANLRQCQ
jgi:hypothetical protein